jgi:L-rhamnose mutarotase
MGRGDEAKKWEKGVIRKGVQRIKELKIENYSIYLKIGGIHYV